MRQVLCFGDSNTFGTNPEGGRHGREERWPGVLQRLLGPEWYVIEEGMGGRTTVWNDPLEPNRCGLAALPIALQSHKPLDLVIVVLGTNDCKAHYNASPRVIAKGAEEICKAIKRFDYGDWAGVPQILLISPIHIDPGVENTGFVSFDASAPEKSRALAPLYRKTAEELGCLFLDGAEYAVPSQTDHLHMDAENHRRFAEAVFKTIREAFP